MKAALGKIHGFLSGLNKEAWRMSGFLHEKEVGCCLNFAILRMCCAQYINKHVRRS